MKGKNRLLSGLLAVLMILSTLAVMPVSAAQIDADTFFSDFENLTVANPGDATTKTELTNDGFKWISSDAIAGNFKIVNDAEYGNALGFVKSGSIGVALGSPVTTGKVYIRFSFKSGDFGYIRPIGTLGSAQTSAGTNIEVDGEKIMYFARVAADSFRVLNGPSYDSVNKSLNLEAGKWHYAEVIVDLDANSWSGYVDGSLVATTTRPLTEANGMDPLPQLQGFYFYSSATSETNGLVDNVLLSYDPTGDMGATVISSKHEVNEDGGQIDICFSEALDSSISEEDISIIKCGAKDTVSVSSVVVAHNKVTVEYGEVLDAGCEYAVVFGDNAKTMNGADINDVAYIYVESEASGGDGAEIIDFDGADVTTAEVKSGGGKTRYQVRSREHYSIFHNNVSTVGADNAYVARVAYICIISLSLNSFAD